MSKARTQRAAQGTKQKQPKPEPPNALHVPASPDGEDGAAVAEALTRPSVAAARVVRLFNLNAAPENMLTLRAVIGEMNKQIEAVNAGSMARPEAILTAQAHALNAMFTNLAERAQNQTGIDQIQCLMGLALRAQSQCRATIEALADIKNPRPVAFVKQANIANGPQQVNNGESANSAQALARGEMPTRSNELLGADDGEQLDTGTAGTASRADRALAALGAINRAAKP